ncbi:formin-binding protein [Oleoguttula sp. CCFEE 5521]
MYTVLDNRAHDKILTVLTVANNFWGKEDAGVTPLLTRIQNAKTTGDELKAFYSARAEIEADYAKRLLTLARKGLGSSEQGTLRMSLDVVRAETDSMGKQHATVAQQMKTELDEPLAAFAGGIKERRKIVQTGIEKLLKTKNGQTAAVIKARDKFEQDCLKIKGYLAQGHMVMGQEERKNKAKMEKTQIQMSNSSQEYEQAVKVLEETTGKWNREWKAACDKFQDLEEERIDFFKSSLWSFANIASTVCVSDDQSCEKVRLSLEDCDVEKDITSFIKEMGTGQEIPDPPKYINFCRGDVDDAASLTGSEDEAYSVAQFPRAMNPTFRTSSPQPSTFESHHDPESSLREEMGMPKVRSSLQGDEAFNARGSTGSGAPPPLNVNRDTPFNPRGSAGSNAQSPVKSMPSDPYAEVPRVPHNPYPADGMTQFCRTGPPSERGSAASPVRPGSSGSLQNSDYTNPTSLSDMEPSSGHQSPVKHYNDSAVSGVSSNGEEKGLQKKKSGFFQSHSPFRRRSVKSKDPAPRATSAAPANRNTWAPAPRGTESATTSPVKPSPFGANGRASTWQHKQPSPSPDPDPVDPRAEYQLGIGNNVFDVASPDARSQLPSARREVPTNLDPIAQALAELKGVSKNASVRQSADRHYGMSTPAPDARGMPPGGVPTPFANAANRGTPPPAYDQPPMSRLGAPQPAHTKREMQKATASFVNQNRDMFNPNQRPSTGSRSNTSQSFQQQHHQQQQPPRAASPAPLRSASPRPFYPSDPRGQQQQQQQQPAYRAPSPNPYGNGPPNQNGRPRAQSSSPIKPQHPQQQQQGYGNPYAPRQASPGYHPAPRAASPNPAYTRPGASSANSRPPSSRGSDNGGMAMQLAPSPGQEQFGGSQRGGPGGPGGRPQSAYFPDQSGGPPGPGGSQVLATRQRSQSQGVQRQFTKDGRPILHYSRAMYTYPAAIPEELSFTKGDVLAVLRLQDDGWWEAEVVGGKGGRAGLVPSNYLKGC